MSFMNLGAASRIFQKEEKDSGRWSWRDGQPLRVFTVLESGHLHGSLQLPVTPVLRDSVPSSGL